MRFSITYFRFSFNERRWFFFFKNVRKLRKLKKGGGGSMLEKRDEIEVSQKAKDYFVQGFN